MFNKIYFLFFISILLGINARAQEPNWHLTQAQEKFKLASTQQGVDKIHRLEEAILLTLPLFYQNKSAKDTTAFQIASLFYQRKDFVQALYFFRQAQLLMPFDKKIQESIQEVKRKLIDNPELAEDNFITASKIFIKLEFISLSWLWILSGVLNLFFWATLTVYYLRQKLIRKTLVKTAIAACSLFIFCFVGVILIKNLQKNNLAISKYSALLYQGAGDFYTHPYSSSNGEEFEIEIEKDNWLQVKTSTNQYFWIKKQDVLLY